MQHLNPLTSIFFFLYIFYKMLLPKTIRSVCFTFHCSSLVKESYIVHLFIVILLLIKAANHFDRCIIIYNMVWEHARNDTSQESADKLIEWANKCIVFSLIYSFLK
jgi:hypothetical protein